MASTAFTIVEGMTSALSFQLLERGVPINLTGCTVTLMLTGSDGVDVTTSGDVTVTTAASGLLTYTPDAADLDAAKSPYKARWKIVDGTGAISFVPTDYRDVWNVVEQ